MSKVHSPDCSGILFFLALEKALAEKKDTAESGRKLLKIFKKNMT